MERRNFLRMMVMAAAGSVLDPEHLLWVPGAKTIFIPSQNLRAWTTSNADPQSMSIPISLHCLNSKFLFDFSELIGNRMVREIDRRLFFEMKTQWNDQFKGLPKLEGTLV